MNEVDRYKLKEAIKNTIPGRNKNKTFIKELFDTIEGDCLIDNFVEIMEKIEYLGFDFPEVANPRHPRAYPHFKFATKIDGTKFYSIDGAVPKFPFGNFLKKTLPGASAEYLFWVAVVFSSSYFYRDRMENLLPFVEWQKETADFKKEENEAKAEVARRLLQKIFFDYMAVLTEKEIVGWWRDVTINMIMSALET